VTQMIETLKKMHNDMIQSLAQDYASSYINSYKELTNQDVSETTIVFGNSSYKTIKQDITQILKEIKKIQRLPVVNFAAGGIATPADASLMMQLGSDGVFVGSGIFKSENPEKRAKAIVDAVVHYEDAEVIAQVSKNLGEAMSGIDINTLSKEQLLQERGW